MPFCLATQQKINKENYKVLSKISSRIYEFKQDIRHYRISKKEIAAKNHPLETKKFLSNY